MKLPMLENSDKYVGLYAVDFGDHSSVGFTAVEVAELLESEQFADVSVYKIHRANPDGSMELKGVRKDIFQLESGMFFYAADEMTARKDYHTLLDWAENTLPPSRSKVQLAKTDDQTFVTALIFPAEFNDEFSRWLLDGQYRTAGAVEGGTRMVEKYYQMDVEILERQPLYPAGSIDSLQGQALLEATNNSVVR